MRAHADADNTQLRHTGGLSDPAGTNFGRHRLEHGFGFFQFVFVRGERDVGFPLVWGGLDDDVDHDIGRGQRVEDIRGGAGLVGHALDGDFRLVAFDADAADDDVFHAWCFCFHDGSRVLIETAAHFEEHVEFVGELDRARLHHFRSG